jgi:hypothetical protein
LSEQRLLPHPVFGRTAHNYINQKRVAPLNLIDAIRHVSNYENMVLRKSPNYESDSNSEENANPIKLYSKVAVLPTNYDSHGMIYLTQPKHRESSDLNRLINKIINYKMDENNYGYLRHTPEEVFDGKEIEQLRDIAQSLEESRLETKELSDTEKAPKIIYEFSDLVV